jgi:hypothetical protein
VDRSVKTGWSLTRLQIKQKKNEFRALSTMTTELFAIFMSDLEHLKFGELETQLFF